MTRFLILLDIFLIKEGWGVVEVYDHCKYMHMQNIMKGDLTQTVLFGGSVVVCSKIVVFILLAANFEFLCMLSCYTTALQAK